MEWFDSFNINYDALTVACRLVLAAILGGLIGFERETHGRPAGFRTHLLVTTGACLMMLISEIFYVKYGILDDNSVVRLDPGRVAAQIITGIGFLGAGAIIKEGFAVRGLTTAACLWVSAGIGMAIGAGLYFPAVLVTAIALFSLLILKRTERLFKKERYRTLRIHCLYDDDVLPKLESFLAERKLRVVNFGFEKDKTAGEIAFTFVVSQSSDVHRNEMIKDFMAMEGVQKVRFT
ncbi:MAG: magnesium transporter MgtC [Desulfuromonas sp.]|nr:MAG: magnesium transporter MgtC [Desulfuromonas sp.]